MCLEDQISLKPSIIVNSNSTLCKTFITATAFIATITISTTADATSTT